MKVETSAPQCDINFFQLLAARLCNGFSKLLKVFLDCSIQPHTTMVRSIDHHLMPLHILFNERKKNEMIQNYWYNKTTVLDRRDASKIWSHTKNCMSQIEPCLVLCWLLVVRKIMSTDLKIKFLEIDHISIWHDQKRVI